MSDGNDDNNGDGNMTNQSNSTIDFCVNSQSEGFSNHTVYQGENDSEPISSDILWWGAGLTGFKGSVQMTGPGGDYQGNKQLMTVTSDSPPDPSPAPTPSGPLALILNNSSQPVSWAYSVTEGESVAGPLEANGGSQAIALTDDLIWFGVYLTPFTGYVEAIGPDHGKGDFKFQLTVADLNGKSKRQRGEAV